LDGRRTPFVSSLDELKGNNIRRERSVCQIWSDFRAS
jgi:hypothetical protein